MAANRNAPVTLTLDTSPFDEAVAGIVRNWKPPVPVKRVIVSEFGSVLAKASENTLAAGPKGAKNKSIAKAKRYLRERYTWQDNAATQAKKKKNAGKAPVLAGKNSTKFIAFKGKIYCRDNYYPPHLWKGIQAHLKKRRIKSMARAGSSKAAWLFMWRATRLQTRTMVATPNSWKALKSVTKAMDVMKKSASWKKATTVKDVSRGRANFVVRFFTKSHNTLNPGSKGASVFQTAMNGRRGFLKRVLGKKLKTTMKNMSKKYPGIGSVS